ncbi:MAG: serine/threonine-protein kinase, partial [Gemmatimonadales bacterium]
MGDLTDRLQTALGAQYAVEHELGGAGMSRVFVALDRELGRRVVVKVLPPERAARVDMGRFRREIQLAASLQHPHIVPLLTAYRAGDLVYYTMPLIEGETLRAGLDRQGALPPADAIRVLRDVVDAISYAHTRGLVHRDIKPDNVLVSGQHALVTDFGVAKAVSEAADAPTVTTQAVAVGTPAYMAPEQAMADPRIDHRADIYAVGALAYELLSGRPPFTGITTQEVLAAHVQDAPVPLSQLEPNVPPELARLVMRCLEKNPADRWQTAAELLAELETLTTPGGGIRVRLRLRVPSRRARRVAVAAGVV